MTTEHENVLPPAVQAQVDQADAIIKQMHDAESGDPATPPVDPATPPVDPQVAPVEPAPPAQVAPSDPAKPREDWKQKYSVLKGKYDAEVPRLHDDLRVANGNIAAMNAQLSSLAATVAALKEVNKPAPAVAEPLVSADEVERFGPDLIDVVERVAKQAVAPYVDQKVGEVAATVKQANESVANTDKSMAELARGRLYDRLDNEVEGWAVINKEPEFVAWLGQEDGLSGQLRGAVLRSAFDRNDADRVVKIFKGFQKEHAVVTPDPNDAAPPVDPATPADPPVEPQQKLDELVAPGTPKTGPTGAHEESGKGRIWTQKDIESFYAKKNELIKKDPNAELPDEIKAQERDLFKAQTENRIR